MVFPVIDYLPNTDRYFDFLLLTFELKKGYIFMYLDVTLYRPDP
jgi:hypothetical protein